MNVTDLPSVNALLNLVSAILLTAGFVAIKGRRPERHRAFMIAALISSTLFLISYLIYHQQVGSVGYPYDDWTRPIYFSVLIPHIILAGLMVPFIVALVWFALRGRFERHRRLARWVWPVWMFVSISGLVVYLMLYHQ